SRRQYHGGIGQLGCCRDHFYGYGEGMGIDFAYCIVSALGLASPLPPFFTNLLNHVSISHTTSSIDSRAVYLCASSGSVTYRTAPPFPLIARYIRSDCIGNVPELLSASP